MPRAARRKREKEKELVETAKKMRKLHQPFYLIILISSQV